jgi:hypothetical protein
MLFLVLLSSDLFFLIGKKKEQIKINKKERITVNVVGTDRMNKSLILIFLIG